MRKSKSGLKTVPTSRSYCIMFCPMQQERAISPMEEDVMEEEEVEV